MKYVIGFSLACWISAAILLLGNSAATTALSGAVALAALDLLRP